MRVLQSRYAVRGPVQRSGHARGDGAAEQADLEFHGNDLLEIKPVFKFVSRVELDASLAVHTLDHSKGLAALVDDAVVCQSTHYDTLCMFVREYFRRGYCVTMCRGSTYTYQLETMK